MLYQLLFLIFTQLSLILATPDRSLFFNYQNNAACILVNDTVYTNFHFEIENPKNQSIPLIIFNYRNLQYFKNLPNFDVFLNHTYLDLEDEKQFISTDNVSNSVGFNLKTFRNYKIPEDTFVELITDKTDLIYQVPEPGVYCIYFPLYSYDRDIIHPTAYAINLKIEEFAPISVFNDISSHISNVILFGLFILPLSYIYPDIRKRRFEKLPPVIQELCQILIVSLVLNGVHVVLELCYLFFPNDFVHSFTENYFGYFKDILLEKWQKYTVCQIYLGLGYKNSPIKTPKVLFQSIFILNVVSTILLDYLMGPATSIIDIYINDKQFEIVKKSILVTRFYKSIFINRNYTDFIKSLITVSTTIQLVSGLIMQLISLIYGVIFVYKLKNHPSLLKPMSSSILIHLIAWSTFGKHAIYNLAIKISVTGIFDAGELLSVIGTLIEQFEIKLVGLQVIEILILWFLWSGGKSFDLSVLKTEEQEEKRKTIVDEKEIKVSKDSKKTVKKTKKVD
ncbi:uncharacterized protein KGF55_005460 [Candida pseudojiufengensis]|uniref:uncharacterized protein n=1 Tax=Candida pseudojiufengensis TaxID=497109 RepID=UPI0022241367|nr:uncharacterized protein KGF55_005460 [Candida pseudojiufengensis]KAI5959310.1 hypothetical protein KGF55_005460 [Candida pseudojiufengensis]